MAVYVYNNNQDENSTGNVWGVSKLSADGSLFNISSYSRRKANEKIEAYPGKQAGIFVSDEALIKELDYSAFDARNTVAKLTNRAVRIHFTDNTLDPILTIAKKRPSTSLTILFATITVKPGYHVTSFFNDRCNMASYCINQDQFVDFVADIPMKDSGHSARAGIKPSISVTMVNETKKTVLVYTILRAHDGALVVKDIEHDMASIPPKGKQGHINMFDFVAKSINSHRSVVPMYRPFSPTYTILVDESQINIKKALNFIANNPRWKHVSEYNITSYCEDDIPSIVADGITAVTLVVDGTLTADELHHGVYHNDVLSAISSKFNIIYIIDGTGKLFKYKY
jgi:hypothetical protein